MTRATTALLASTLLLAACAGSSGSTGAAASSTPPTTLEVAGPTPSESATMVCAAEARSDIAAAIGLDAQQVTKPTWRESVHMLACDYEYAPRARMTLSVKEMSSIPETTGYFDLLARRLGRTRAFDIGQGAYTTTDGSLVVRKDYKVLLVDVSRLRARFGSPPAGRGSIAINVGQVVMTCWSGG